MRPKMRVTLEQFVLLALLSQSFGKKCATCSGTDCNTSSEQMECNRNIPVLPFDVGQAAERNTVDVDYGCLDLEYTTEDGTDTQIRQCVFVSAQENTCQSIGKKVTVKQCFIDSSINNDKQPEETENDKGHNYDTQLEETEDDKALNDDTQLEEAEDDKVLNDDSQPEEAEGDKGHDDDTQLEEATISTSTSANADTSDSVPSVSPTSTKSTGTSKSSDSTTTSTVKNNTPVTTANTSDSATGSSTSSSEPEPSPTPTPEPPSSTEGDGGGAFVSTLSITCFLTIVFSLIL